MAPLIVEPNILYFGTLGGGGGANMTKFHFPVFLQYAVSDEGNNFCVLCCSVVRMTLIVVVEACCDRGARVEWVKGKK